MRTMFVLALSGIGISFAGACASTPDTVAPRTAVRYDEHVDVGQRAAARDIYIEDRVGHLCDIPRTTSYFAVGSAGVDEVEWASVKRVADCMKDGALKEEKIVVIGYTDRRGSETFNVQLGMQRAEAVAAALVSNGIDRERVYVKSYGEQKAKDKMSEDDWARDRKVTLRVAQPL